MQTHGPGHIHMVWGHLLYILTKQCWGSRHDGMQDMLLRKQMLPTGSNIPINDAVSIVHALEPK